MPGSERDHRGDVLESCDVGRFFVARRALPVELLLLSGPLSQMAYFAISFFSRPLFSTSFDAH